jgi:hypothetical protein
LGRYGGIALGGGYTDGGETSVNNMPQGNAINGFRPCVAISRAIWKYRFTLRLERSASTRTPRVRTPCAVVQGVRLSFLNAGALIRY